MQNLPSKILVCYLGILFLGWLTSLNMVFADNQEKQIIGWVETVQILPENFQISAKIDTGADNSSLNITDPVEFFKGNDPWIRFTVPLGKNKHLTIEKPIERSTHIKRKGAPSLKRPVVLIDLCVGSMYKKNAPVNLADRSGFKYPMLIGRSFLKGLAIVDSELTDTKPPSCLNNSSE